MDLEKDVVWKEKEGYYSFEKYVKTYKTEKKDKKGKDGEKAAEPPPPVIKETVITIPSEYKGLPVKEIGDAAFSMNTVVEKVIIPDSIEKIGTMAFNQCTALDIDGLSPNLARLGYFAFNQTKARNNPAFNVNKMFIIDDWLVTVDDDVENIEIPPYIKGVADYAFNFCGKLKKIILPEGLKYLGMNAFAFALDLDEVYIPRGVSAHWKIFGANVNIKKLTIPQDVYERQKIESTVKIGEVKLI